MRLPEPSAAAALLLSPLLIMLNGCNGGVASTTLRPSAPLLLVLSICCTCDAGLNLSWLAEVGKSYFCPDMASWGLGVIVPLGYIYVCCDLCELRVEFTIG